MRADEGAHDGVHRPLHLGVGQRAIESAERQPERETDPAVRNALAGIPIELARAFERVRRGGPDSATNCRRRQDIVDDDREIADD